MSTSVDLIETLKNDKFRISGTNIRKIRAMNIHLAEQNFLEDMPEKPKSTEFYLIENLTWYGTGSGSGGGFDTLTEKVLPLTLGTYEAAVYWEGNGAEGLRVVDGVVTQPKLLMSLEPS